MAWKDISTLKGYFVTGAVPTEEQFADLIDSAVGGLVSPLHFSAAGDGDTDDTAAWLKLAKYVNEKAADWPDGFGVRPKVIDLCGRTFRISEDVTFCKNVHLMNGRILSNGATVTLAPGTGDKRISHSVTAMEFIYDGQGYYDGALLRIPACFNVNLVGAYIDAGKGSSGNRARYGLFMGETKAFGVNISGGRYYGGDIALRIGQDTDHTGLSISGITAGHSRLANILICNPAGASISGCNIEHSDHAGVGLAITSQTNGSANVGHSVSVESCYFFNIGNGGGAGTSPAGILVGHDVPGTDGFDVPSQPITSADSAYGISIRNNYLVSNAQARAAKVRALAGVEITNNLWLTQDNTAGFELSGVCGTSTLRGNRNQNTGDFDLFVSDAKRLINVSKQGAYKPALFGATVKGANKYGLRSGDYSVENGLCTVTGTVNVSEIDGAMNGPLRLSLPLPCLPGRRAGATVTAFGLPGGAGQAGVAGVIFEGNDFIVLKWQGSGSNLVAAEVGKAPSLQFTAIYPVDLALLGETGSD